MIEGTKVFIKSIPRNTATNISEFRDGKGKRLNKNKIGKCRDALRAYYSEKTGKLNTGLDLEVENPYFETKNHLDEDFEYLRNKPRCTLQEVLEVKHRVEKGTYTSRAWRPGDGYRDQDLTYFQKFKKKMNDGTTILDLSVQHDELAYYMLKAHPLVAASNKHEDRIKRPKAEYYIADVNESMQDKYSKRTREIGIFSKLSDPKFTPSYQGKVAKALELIKGDVGATSIETIFNILDSYLQENFKANKDDKIDKFEELYDLTTSADGRVKLEAMCFLSDLVSNRIVSENRGTYTWLSKAMVIGQRKADVIEFLLDPKKQPEQDELKKQLKAKLIR